MLSRTEIDKSASLTLKMDDKIPIREIEKDTKTDTPDVTVSSIDTKDETFSPKTQQTEFEEQLKMHGSHKSYFNQLTR